MIKFASDRHFDQSISLMKSTEKIHWHRIRRSKRTKRNGTRFVFDSQLSETIGAAIFSQSTFSLRLEVENSQTKSKQKEKQKQKKRKREEKGRSDGPMFDKIVINARYDRRISSTWHLRVHCSGNSAYFQLTSSVLMSVDSFELREFYSVTSYSQWNSILAWISSSLLVVKP